MTPVAIIDSMTDSNVIVRCAGCPEGLQSEAREGRC